ncbi:MAG: sensor histidine kinase [bacterium]|nr:sensor histidine kinase [bacterium]
MNRLTLGVHPRVVFQLGESLVTDPVQALLELVKNSYDADATLVTVEVNTHVKEADLQGRIVVEDNGIGMSEQTIREGWLTISVSPKAAMKESGQKTLRHHRVPLGDKGVGRLGTQRLGHRLTIRTFEDQRPDKKRSREPVSGRELVIDWRAYDSVDRLDEVEFRLEKVEEESAGTRLMIEGLKDSAEWSGDGKNRLGAELSKLVSPFDPPKNFSLDIRVDDAPVELTQLDRIVRRAALSSWHIDFDETSLRVDGSVRGTFLRPDRKDHSEWRSLVVDDGGERLYQFLKNDPRARDLGVSEPSSSSQVARFQLELGVDELDASVAPGAGGDTPGPFSASFESFSLGRFEVQELVGEYLQDDGIENHVFTKEAEYRELMKDLAGVRVYRDGFGVRVGGDWLGLGAGFTSARSFRALRPANTIGYINISAERNQSLVETTDREGFVHNGAYRTFVALLEEAISYINSCQVLVGRNWDSLKKEESRKIAGIPEGRPARQVATGVTDAVRQGEQLRTELQRAKSAIGTAMKSTPELTEARDTVEEVERLLDRLPEVQAQAEVVENELEELERNRAEYIEMIGLGLTAEALAHELSMAINRLDAATRAMARKLRSPKGATQEEMAGYLADVQYAIAALRKQLAHLDPSLRYARDQRTDVTVGQFIGDIAEYHRSRWEGSELELEVRIEDDFKVRANPGRMTQVFDNLILNSEHWVRQTKKRPARIEIVVSNPFVEVSDSGPGVHDSVRDSLFEPFVTRKPRGKGRGLGLFVARQLLDLENSEIRLAPNKNAHGRLYLFELDFSGALVG